MSVDSIVKLFNSSSPRRDIYTLFSDFCEAAAISISNSVDLSQKEEREKRYLEIINRYDKETQKLFPKIFTEITMTLESGMDDVMGKVFHALELQNKWVGQFFTPTEYENERD